MSKIIRVVSILALYLVGCSASNSSEDVTIGSVAAGAIGASLASTSSSGTQAFFTPAGKAPFDLLGWIPDAYAAGACATMATAAGAGCTNGSSAVTLSYSACNFGTSTAVWSGLMEVRGAGVACGSFPTGSVTRQFVISAGGAAHTGTRTNSAGKVVTIDHSTADLGNYEGDTISTLVNSGYGTSVTIGGGVRTAVAVRQRMTGTLFDISVNGNLAVSETSNATSRTLSGSVTTYHNVLKVKGTAAFSSVVYSNSCCTPVSGTITTTLAATSQSDSVGQALDGKTQTLEFTGCGSATATSTSGTTSSVAVTACY
jgi:hypothetical protein